jgi:integrase
MGRRSNGEGTLFKRKDGRWSAQAYVKLPNGTAKRICITNRSHDVVKEKLRDALDKEHRNIPFVERDWTISDYLDYWMREIQPSRIRESTIVAYNRLIGNHIKPSVGGFKLKNLTVYNVRCALEEMKRRGCPDASLHKCFKILSSCLNCAVREEIIFRNVASIVEKPKYTPKETSIWTVKQSVAFLQSIKEHPQYITFLLLFTYGMRRGEVLGLRYSDIDFENGKIYVRQQIDRINGRITASVLKTKKSRRELPLRDYVRSALIKYAKTTGVIIPQFNPNFELSIHGTVVVSNAGTPLEPRNLGRLFDSLSKKAGLPHIKIHATRHMTATLLKDLNVPDKDIQDLLGHAKITTTKNIYQHGTQDTQHNAISAIEEYLHNGGAVSLYK